MEKTYPSDSANCPECHSEVVFHRVGKFRSQCTNCNALVTNEEIGRENLDPQ